MDAPGALVPGVELLHDVHPAAVEVTALKGDLVGDPVAVGRLLVRLPADAGVEDDAGAHDVGGGRRGRQDGGDHGCQENRT
jgi:hypothetical protein